jgi:hypothetical protein
MFMGHPYPEPSRLDRASGLACLGSHSSINLFNLAKTG